MAGSTDGTVSMYQGTDLVKRASIFEYGCRCAKLGYGGAEYIGAKKRESEFMHLTWGSCALYTPARVGRLHATQAREEHAMMDRHYVRYAVTRLVGQAADTGTRLSHGVSQRADKGV